jgi:predicted amidohydrolase YtcJ
MLAADLVIQGTVLTVDELQPTAEASAVSDGRIIAVGERADIESWIGPGTEVIDMYEDALRRWPATTTRCGRAAACWPPGSG